MRCVYKLNTLKLCFAAGIPTRREGEGSTVMSTLSWGWCDRFWNFVLLANWKSWRPEAKEWWDSAGMTQCCGVSCRKPENSKRRTTRIIPRTNTSSVWARFFVNIKIFPLSLLIPLICISNVWVTLDASPVDAFFSFSLAQKSVPHHPSRATPQQREFF